MFHKSKLMYSPDDIIAEKINPGATFMELINDIKTRYKNQMKVVYAYFEEDIDELHQYLLVLKQEQINKKTQKPLTVYAAIPIVRFGRGCLEMYSICKRKGELNDFFKEFFDTPITFDEKKFKYFINVTCELSFDKDAPNYWKTKESAKVFMDTIGEMGTMYESVLKKGG